MSRRINIMIWIVCGIACAVLLWVSASHGAPFLVCDPDPNCETYKMYADGVLLQEDLPAPLSYDLVSSPPGGIAYTAECCNVEGCSDPSDPYISLGVPSSPSSLRISIQP